MLPERETIGQSFCYLRFVVDCASDQLLARSCWLDGSVSSRFFFCITVGSSLAYITKNIL